MTDRRTFLNRTGQALAVTALLRNSGMAQAAPAGRVRMKMDLTFPKLGVSCPQRRAMDLAAANGFKSVGVDTGQIGRLAPGEVESLNNHRVSLGLVWGVGGCPVDFRRDEAEFARGLEQLETVGPRLRQLGVQRLTAWISPAHAELTYRKNFDRHVERMKRLDDALGRHELRLGLEYVGTQLGRFNRKHSFIHTSAEVLELIEAAHAGHLGLIVDSWHWWTSGEDAADLRRLTASQIVSVELNDAPEGLAREQQIDNQRRLPASTGVLPLADFMTALAAIEFDGPVYAEPFYAPLRQEPVETVASQVAEAMKRAFNLLP